MSNHAGGISPFSEAGLKHVWEATKPNPRDFLRALEKLLALGNSQLVPVLDEVFIVPKLEGMVSSVRNEPTERTDERNL